MDVAVIGLHKRFCDEAFFKKVYEQIDDQILNSDDVVLLKTCNRIEIYLASQDIVERHPNLLKLFHQPGEEHSQKRFYTFIGFDVLRHLAQVASGLDSLICGESDIQNQVKKAYEQQGRFLTSDGHFLFQKALHIAKKLRQQFDIKPTRSLVDQVCQHILPALKSGEEILFIGQSELNQQIYKKLLSLSCFQASIMSKTKPEQSSCFAQATWCSYQNLGNLTQFHKVFCATKDIHLETWVKFNSQAFIYDLSRPKILQCFDGNYFDLTFFETLSEQSFSRQQNEKALALSYLEKNVERLHDSKQLRLLFSAS